MRVGTWNQGAYAGYPDNPSCRSSGSSIRPRRSRRNGSPAASRSPTRISTATGSPTSSARPSNTAAATSSGWTRPTACSPSTPAPPPRPRRPRWIRPRVGRAGFHRQHGTPPPARSPPPPRPRPAAARSARRRCRSPSPRRACTRSARPTPAPRSTNTSPPPACPPATHGARPSSPGHSSTPATRCPAAAGPPSRPGSTTPSNTRTGCRSSAPTRRRPGDIVAYDWGGGTDFSGDGHIGFLASNVQNGQFNALEGNNADAVNLVPRQLGGGPNIVFIRVNGDTPAGGATPPIPDPTATPGTPVATAATAGTPPTPPAPTPPRPRRRAILRPGDRRADPRARSGRGRRCSLKRSIPSSRRRAPVAQAASAAPAPGGAADAAAASFAGAGHLSGG